MFEVFEEVEFFCKVHWLMEACVELISLKMKTQTGEKRFEEDRKIFFGYQGNVNHFNHKKV